MVMSDIFANAPLINLTDLPTTSLLSENIVPASVETNEPVTFGSRTVVKTLWCKFVSPITGKLGIALSNVGTPHVQLNTMDALIGVYTGTSLTGLTRVHESDPEMTSLDVVKGETYYLQVGATASTGQSSFDLHITTNDNLSNAFLLSTTTGSFPMARVGHLTLETNEPRAAQGKVWYRLKTGETSGSATFKIDQYQTDGTLMLYKSTINVPTSFSELTELKYSDVLGGSADEVLTHTLDANTVYVVAAAPHYASVNGAEMGFIWTLPSVSVATPVTSNFAGWGIPI